MKIYYGESEIITVDKQESRIIKVNIYSHPICINIDKKDVFNGYVYDKRCNPLEDVKVTAIYGGNIESSFTNKLGNFKIFLPIYGKECSFILYKEGYNPCYIEKYLIKDKKIRIFLSIFKEEP